MSTSKSKFREDLYSYLEGKKQTVHLVFKARESHFYEKENYFSQNGTS